MKIFQNIYFRSLVLVTAITFIGLWYWYGGFIAQPSQLFQNNGDGKKNYYTIEYHVLHDSTELHFRGMNYPYGEQVLYTDNQPALAAILRFVHHHILHLEGRVIPVLNILMLLGIWLCAILLCLVFLEFGVVWWYGALAAVGISFLSPQLMRFLGHYALSYSFYLPLLWLLWIRYYKKPALSYSVAICLVIVFSSLIHLYYLPLGLFFGGALWIFYYAKYKPKIASVFLDIFIQLLLPVIIIKGFIALTDHITDRPAHPYGFMQYKAFWEGVFLPAGMQLGNFISAHIVKIRPLDFENYIYVGLTSSLVFGALLFLFFKFVFKGKIRQVNPAPQQPILGISFWAAFAVLLFSLGLPFIAGMEWLLDYSGPLKQFRSFGRFAWVFYYVINVYAFASIYFWSQNRKRKWTRPIVILLSLCLITYDNFQIKRAAAVSETAQKPFTAPLIFDPAQYQAILPLPFFHEGSENYDIGPVHEIFNFSADLSIKTGLPMLAVQMSRTSNSQTLKSLVFATEEYRPLAIVKDLPDKKPVLIVICDTNDLKTFDFSLLAKSRFIGKDGLATYYELTYDSLAQYGRDMYARKKGVSACKDQVNTNKDYYYQSFDSLKSDKSYFGGAATSKPGKDLTLYDADLITFHAGQGLVSFWAYIGDYPYSLMQLEVKETDKSGKLVSHHNSSIGGAMAAIDGNWALIEMPFEIKDKANRFKILIGNHGNEKSIIYADELLIREAGSCIGLPRPGFWVCNNRFYPR